MTLVLTLIAIALVALLFLLRSAKRRASAPHSWDEIRFFLRPVDLQAFRNLIDPEEEQFLRLNLSHRSFRKVQRERCFAALRYISCAAHNAAILARVGDVARRNADPAIAEAGAKLANSAVRLRLFAFQATGKLYFAILVPSSTRLYSVGLAESYERLTRQSFLLVRRQKTSLDVSATA